MVLGIEPLVGVLRVYGLHLKGAEIKMATSCESKNVLTVTYEKICGGEIDVLSCKDLLPDTNLRTLYVHAIKPTLVSEGGRKVNVISSSVKIEDIHLKKALRDWLPAIFSVIFEVRLFWLSTKAFWNADLEFFSEVYWTLPILVIVIFALQLLSRKEKWMTEKLWSLCFSYSMLRLYVSSLGSLELDLTENQEIPKSTETLKNPLGRYKRVRNSRSLAPKSGSSSAWKIPKLLSLFEDDDDSDDDSDGDSNGKSKRKGDEALSDNQFEGEELKVDGDTPRRWEWDTLELLKGKHGSLVERKRTREVPKPSHEAELIPFRVIYDLSSEAPWPAQLYVHIKSRALLSVVQNLLPNAKQVRIHVRGDYVGIKGTALFLALEELKKELHQTKDRIRTGGESIKAPYNYQVHWQLEHLVRFLEEEYGETSTRHQLMNSNARVSWDMLWTFLTPGVKVVKSDIFAEDRVCGMLEEACYAMRKGEWTLRVTLKLYDYNLQSFTSYNAEDRIDPFQGEVEFVALDLYPIRFAPTPKSFKERLLNRGAAFGYLSTTVKCRYMHYTGMMFRLELGRGNFRMLKEKADGRVMVDLAGFSKMNADYFLRAARPPPQVLRDNKVKVVNISKDKNRIFAPSFVYGFSFRLKTWGAFSVGGFAEITYNDHAWDEVVMDRKVKEMIEVLVCENLQKEISPDNVQQSGIDTISHKGESCIVLCHGPPGTGKTLTAEALADKEKVPLWAMSVSELGIDPDKLETQLVKIFDVAYSWRALLLLDEADVYLERRADKTDLLRNAMTGIFLRQLEYYKGVLFLTTNRKSTFDEAFQSRIALFIRFEALDENQRKQVWENFLRRVEIAAGEKIPEIVDTVSVYDLNGRQIRNAIQNARKLAIRFGNGMLSSELLMRAAKIMHDSVAGG